MTDEQIALEHARLIVRDVCEIPDRTSPDDQPEMMMVTVPELTGIAQTRLLAALAAARQDAIAECVRRLREDWSEPADPAWWLEKEMKK